MGKSGTVWTGAEISFLRKNMDKDEEFLMRHLGRSNYSVRSMKYKILRGFEAIDEDYIEPGQLMTKDEKVARIHRMAAEMRVRLQK